MDIWEADKFLLFLAFVIPGFISLKTYAILGLQAPRDSTQQVIDAIAYSCINYALLLWPILEVQSSGWLETRPSLYSAFCGVVLLVAPVIWAILWRWARTTQLLQGVLPHPIEKPWDFVFRKRLPYWVIVTFKDGKQVAGRYASKSFSSASPSAEQIYLEETWVLNQAGGFERPRSESAGILVLGSEISSVELFHISQGVDDGNEAHSVSAREKRVAAESKQTAGQ